VFRTARAVLAVIVWLSLSGMAAQAEAPSNLFRNAGFESGNEGWGASIAGGTSAGFDITEEGAAAGERCALVSIGNAAGYGYQFGQRVPSGQVGEAYTFAVLAQAVGGPALVRLEVERAGGDYARAGRSGPTVLMPDRWTELHTTFTVQTSYPEDWFAYVSCTQPNVKFRVDEFRLYAGDYVPHPVLKGAESEPGGGPPERMNLFANAGFEMGTAGWSAAKPADTEVDFSVTDDDAVEGERSALVAVGAVTGWGLQLGLGPAGADRSF